MRKKGQAAVSSRSCCWCPVNGGLVVDRCDATPSTKCGKGSGSLAQDEKLSIYPTIEVAGLTKQLLDCNSVVSADAPGLSAALCFIA